LKTLVKNIYFIRINILLLFCWYKCWIFIGFVEYIYFLLFVTVFLSSGGLDDRLSLDEVVLHVSLEVEVGELVLLAELKELGKTRIGVDLASIALVLKTVGVDVAVDLLADLSASHLGTNGLSEELGKLITDASGLDETRGLSVGVVAALLGRSLLGVLHLTGNNLLERLVVVLEGRKDTDEELELGTEVGHLNGKGGTDVEGSGGGKLIGNGAVDLGSGRSSSRLSNRWGHCGGLLLRCSGLLGTGGLGCSGCGLLGSINGGSNIGCSSVNGSGSSSGSFRSSNHGI